MKKYLSFGGGVNSVALYLYLIEQGENFEAVFVDHGGDYPETYNYVKMFAEKHPLTIIKAVVHRKNINQSWNTIIDFCTDRKIIPQQYPRWCTGEWKKDQINRYIERPCFMMIGIDWSESHRAKIQMNGRIEYRYPLIEAEIDRNGCKQIIMRHGLPIPSKSGCYICPFQGRQQLKALRLKHPDLFCKVQELEKASGRTLHKKMSVGAVIDENQHALFTQDEYPPCQCGL